ncbi:MAG: hypothetical protein AABX51_03650 [Nanoarchaeota archaeon]
MVYESLNTKTIMLAFEAAKGPGLRARTSEVYQRLQVELLPFEQQEKIVFDKLYRKADVLNKKLKNAFDKLKKMSSQKLAAGLKKPANQGIAILLGPTWREFKEKLEDAVKPCNDILELINPYLNDKNRINLEILKTNLRNILALINSAAQIDIPTPNVYEFYYKKMNNISGGDINSRITIVFYNLARGSESIVKIAKDALKKLNDYKNNPSSQKAADNLRKKIAEALKLSRDMDVLIESNYLLIQV